MLFEANIVTDNIFVVFCIMDYEGHLPKVNKVIYDFFLWKKKEVEKTVKHNIKRNSKRSL